jgi:hypothetical protein
MGEEEERKRRGRGGEDGPPPLSMRREMRAPYAQHARMETVCILHSMPTVWRGEHAVHPSSAEGMMRGWCGHPSYPPSLRSTVRGSLAHEQGLRGGAYCVSPPWKPLHGSLCWCNRRRRWPCMRNAHPGLEYHRYAAAHRAAVVAVYVGH